MNAHVIELDASIHQKVQKLLPWAVLDKLPADEQTMVAEHVAVCAHCREELEWQRELQAVQPAAGATPDMEGALARLTMRLDEFKPVASQTRWMRWGLAAQLFVIAGLGAALALQSMREPQVYRLLGVAPTGASFDAHMIVVFEPSTTEGQMRAALQASAARVADGPTEANAWLLRVPAASLPTALAAMRANSHVKMAEPLQTDSQK
jgi:hypothetical protein